ncbi:hypothetical protein [Thomasclavelia cocleata]|nr:hypothetical protein [Thomasclavelia cocleata]
MYGIALTLITLVLLAIASRKNPLAELEDKYLDQEKEEDDGLQ